MCKSCGFFLYVSCRNCNTNAGSIVDRPLLNTKLMLPNSTIVRSMWFIILSNRFTEWDISFILKKLLHSSMIPCVSSLNLHEYAMADVSTASISFSRHTNPCSLVFFILQYESGLITCLIHLHLTQLLSYLFYGYRRYFSFSISRIQQLPFRLVSFNNCEKYPLHIVFIAPSSVSVVHLLSFKYMLSFTSCGRLFFVCANL